MKNEKSGENAYCQTLLGNCTIERVKELHAYLNETI